MKEKEEQLAQTVKEIIYYDACINDARETLESVQEKCVLDASLKKHVAARIKELRRAYKIFSKLPKELRKK
jgi:predicted Zn-dependent protease